MQYYEAFNEINERRLPGNGFGSLAPLQYDQVRGWLDLYGIEDVEARRDYVYFVFALDEAYRYFIEKKGELDKKVEAKKEITAQDLKLSFDDGDEITMRDLELEQKRIEIFEY